jgi:mono/diheme cytochrome c family protein
MTRTPAQSVFFIVFAALAALAQTGCETSSQASFVLNAARMRQIDEAEQSEQSALTKEIQDEKDANKRTQLKKDLDDNPQRFRQRRQAVANIIEALFGTPDDPHLPADVKLDLKKLRLAAGPTASHEKEAHTGLYRRHCVHCHGVTGDGRGPTAVFLNPYPRDFRHGVVKFKSTKLKERPTDDDLRRTINAGVAGTAMPSFKLLAPSEVDALIEYVKYLAIRGETETALIAKIAQLSREESLPDPTAGKEQVDEFRAQIIEEVLKEGVLGRWERATESVEIPPERKPLEGSALDASIVKGRELFMGKANCFSCHGDTALGDGQTYMINVPPGVIGNIPNEITNWELPPQPLSPRNLRNGVFRGGRRPMDIYRKIHVGIEGTPMPARVVGLTDEEVWSLVDYVLNMPYEVPIAQPEAELKRPTN